MPKPTINDVAKMAGVSIKTVSRVLNNEPHVRETLKTKVQEAIQQLNYRPSQSARSLAGNRSYIIGLLYANLSPGYIIDVQRGVLSRCHEEGYDLLIHPYEWHRNSLTEDINELIAKKVDGLILAPPIAELPTLLEELDSQKVPYVRISPEEITCNGIQVCCNEREAARDMTRYLISLGHKRIGLILGSLSQSSARERLLGYKDALSEAGIAYRESYTHEGQYSFEIGQHSARYLLDLHDRPSAIFASNDEMALATISVALGRGLSIPDQLSVAGFDDIPGAQQCWPSLTTVRQPIFAQGELAADLLLTALQGKTPPKHTPALQCELVLRQSTGICPDTV